MLWRSGLDRQNATSGATSDSAAFMSAPCQAPGPYPSRRMRGSTCVRASRGASVLVAVFVLILPPDSRVREYFLARHRDRVPTVRWPCTAVVTRLSLEFLANVAATGGRDRRSAV